jgi:hypothetical protein
MGIAVKSLTPSLQKIIKKEIEEISGVADKTCITACFCNNDGELYVGACNTNGVCC